MQERRKPLPPLSLSRALYGYVVMTFLLLAALGVVFVSNRSADIVDAALDTAVRVRSEAAAQTLARTLHADWQDLEQLASVVGTGPEAEVSALMTGLRGTGTRISWVGFADTTGTVRIASEGMLEGQDVSARPWFRSGLQGGFAGDLHEAVLLASLLPQPDNGEPLRFVDLALPVRNSAGELTGVLGAHIDVAWVRKLLEETAAVSKLDLFLVSADGSVALATTETVAGVENLAVLRSARAGIASSGRETWPNGRAYFSSMIPTVAYADLPSFGWRLVGRLDAASFRPAFASARGLTISLTIATVAILAAMTAVFVLMFLRPIEALSLSAERIASGVEEFPPEGGISRESVQLSAALARLQQDRDRANPVNEDET